MTDFLVLLDKGLPFIILGILILVWMYISRLSFYFFTTTTVNRFRFRYWTIIALFNLFHLMLAIAFKTTGEELFQTLRWQVFFLVDILTIEVFINVIKNRTMEIGVRSIFYFSAIVNSVTDFWIFAIVMGLILMGLSYQVVDKNLRRIYLNMFVWYMLAMTAPYWNLTWLLPKYEGYGNILSLSIGAIYSIFVARAIYKLYKMEKIQEKRQLQTEV